MPRPRFDLEDRLIDFAVEICRLLERFRTGPPSSHVSKQLLRCATAPFANYGEAQAAESRADFIHKLRICLKELREAQSWLKFVERMKLSPDDLGAVRQESNELIPIMVVSIRTSEQKLRPDGRA